MEAALSTAYKEQVVPKLIESQGYQNRFEVPKIEKIVINMGVGIQGDRDELAAVADDLAKITGQRPVVTRAKNSISNFKLREGMPLGCKVTLRGSRMYEFLERLINVALPRIRDFRGVSNKAFDGRGNYTLGLQEQVMFPEINPDKVKKNQGMDISFVTTANTNEEAFELLKLLGIPFAGQNN